MRAYSDRMKFESDERERQTRLQIARMKEAHNTRRAADKNDVTIRTAQIGASAKPKYKH